jgi:hypothetical protein
VYALVGKFIIIIINQLLLLIGTSTSSGAKCTHLVSAYQGTLGNNSLYYIDFRQRNLHNL